VRREVPYADRHARRTVSNARYRRTENIALDYFAQYMAMLGPHVAIRTAVTPEGAAARGC